MQTPLHRGGPRGIPLWVLLGFALWALLLFGTVGIYRWSRILTGRAAISAFHPDQPHGSDWYRRAMRAHPNCIENLPVYGAIVLVMAASCHKAKKSATVRARWQ